MTTSNIKGASQSDKPRELSPLSAFMGSIPAANVTVLDHTSLLISTVSRCARHLLSAHIKQQTGKVDDCVSGAFSILSVRFFPQDSVKTNTDIREE